MSIQIHIVDDNGYLLDQFSVLPGPRTPAVSDPHLAHVVREKLEQLFEVADIEVGI